MGYQAEDFLCEQMPRILHLIRNPELLSNPELISLLMLLALLLVLGVTFFILYSNLQLELFKRI
jgi:hypothetical protein